MDVPRRKSSTPSRPPTPKSHSRFSRYHVPPWGWSSRASPGEAPASSSCAPVREKDALNSPGRWKWTRPSAASVRRASGSQRLLREASADDAREARTDPVGRHLGRNDLDHAQAVPDDLVELAKRPEDVGVVDRLDRVKVGLWRTHRPTWGGKVSGRERPQREGRRRAHLEPGRQALVRARRQHVERRQDVRVAQAVETQGRAGATGVRVERRARHGVAGRRTEYHSGPTGRRRARR